MHYLLALKTDYIYSKKKIQTKEKKIIFCYKNTSCTWVMTCLYDDSGDEKKKKNLQ